MGGCKCGFVDCLKHILALSVAFLRFTVLILIFEKFKKFDQFEQS
jgi:hypothetical protein